MLPSHIHPLRKALDAASVGPTESVIRSGKGWYRFVGQWVRLDETELDERAAEARHAMVSGDVTTAMDRFSEALALFRGEPLSGLPGHRAEAERQRLLRPSRTRHSSLSSRSESRRDLEELTAAWGAATSPLRLLLVLDDALDADQIRPLLPAGAGSRVLVAGRRRLAELDTDRRVTLEPLESDAAVSLLTHIIGAERAGREPEATHHLVGLCDGLPLALRIAGSRLQNRSTWTVEYLVDRMAVDDQLLNPLTDPSHDWLEMHIRSRLGHAYLATGRTREAGEQFQIMLDVHSARAHRADHAVPQRRRW